MRASGSASSVRMRAAGLLGSVEEAVEDVLVDLLLSKRPQVGAAWCAANAPLRTQGEDVPQT
jgi:hypothetical protein